MTIPRTEAEPALKKFEEKIGAMAAESLDAKRRFFERSSRDLALAATMIIESMRAGGKLLIFGNGGSAADAQHIAAELAFKMVREREALPALALTTDTSLLTAISNDRSFDFVFARQIQAIGRKGDVVLAMSDGVTDNLWEHEISANALKSLRTWLEKHAAEDTAPKDSRGVSESAMKFLAEELVLAARQIAEDPFAESPFMEKAVDEGLAIEGGKLDDISVVAGFVRRRDVT